MFAIGIDDEDREQLCGCGCAVVLCSQMVSTGNFKEAFACVVDVRKLAVDLLRIPEPPASWFSKVSQNLLLRIITGIIMVTVMAHIGTGVEYALHCLTWIAAPLERPPSSRDLAEMQGVPPAFLKKIFPKLEKAGIVEATGGIRGGYRLARSPEQISVLDVVDAVEGQKRLFDCQEIRGRCALFEGKPPAWSTRGVCGIHAVMIRAEKVMRDELAKTSLAMLMGAIVNKVQPASFADDVRDWFAGRQTAREDARISAMRSRATTRPDDESA